MLRPFHVPDVERFRELVAHVLGLRVDEDDSPSLEDLLATRMRARGCSTLAAYEPVLTHSLAEAGELARLLCVNETYLLRHGEQFAELGRWLRRHAGKRRPLSLLSAGCASGEEAFSIAITAREALEPLDVACVSILGVDVDPDAVRAAKLGVLPKWSLRDVPEIIRERYVTALGQEFVLADSIREMVALQHANLLRPQAELFSAARWDVVFCRNVLMYLTPDAAATIVRKISDSIVDGGLLFLGHAETLRGLSSDFDVVHGSGTFLYVRKARRERAPPRAYADTDGAWVRAIARSSERIERLSRASLCTGAGLRDAGGARDGHDLERAVALFEAERFTDALAALDEGAPARATPLDASLLRAVMLVNDGQLEAAERACDGLLARSDLDAPSHYLKALCRELAGDPAGAAGHDRLAIYLDPGFSMPQLHLGLLSRRSGDIGTACRALRTACRLLEHEDPRRVALFGGGFGREALVALCRSQLAACESES